ncbi:cysteine desulfurase [Candidatus Woesearchaeota archaeon]|nr:cysteine desulfurase [Candidatus Woesearchaeota archaeon]
MFNLVVEMNTQKIRKDFPVLEKGIIYMDSACVSLKPQQVVKAMNCYYNEFPACAGRSMHKLGEKVTEEVSKARKIIAKFFNAKPNEIVFTKNTTESINLVANSLGLKKGDKVITTDKEHNSNLLPWQNLAKRGIIHEIIKSNEDNTFNMDKFKEKIKGAKLVSMVHTSNLDGVTIPAEEIIKIAHEHGALVLLDAAQSVPHKEINVKKLDVDFLACSGHKMLGPSGTGILYGKYHLLEKLEPFLIGGDTVIDTTYTTAEFEKPPEKFEAGLQNYAGIIGLAEAARYLMKIGRKNISKHETELNKKITNELLKIDGIKIIGPEDPELRSGIISFNYKDADPHEIALLLDSSADIMVRSGAHCVHSWFNAHNLKGSARVSLYIYNTEEECDKLIEEINKIVEL